MRVNLRCERKLSLRSGIVGASSSRFQVGSNALREVIRARCFENLFLTLQSDPLVSRDSLVDSTVIVQCTLSLTEQTGISAFSSLVSSLASQV